MLCSYYLIMTKYSYDLFETTYLLTFVTVTVCTPSGAV